MSIGYSDGVTHLHPLRGTRHPHCVLTLTISPRQLINDPDTRINHFKPLRLVCKIFNVVWSPVVLSNLVLFLPESDPHHGHHRGLRHVVHDMAVARTVTLKSWHCLSVDAQRVGRRLYPKSKWAPVRRMLSALASAAVAPPMKFVRLLVNPGLSGARQSANELVNKVSFPDAHHTK